NMERLAACSRLVALVTAIPTWPATAGGAPLPESAVLIDDDIVGDLHEHSMLAVSPDSQQIAYVSRGALWVAQIDRGPAKRVAELPNTLTEILVDFGYAATRTRFNRVGTTDLPRDYYPRRPLRIPLTTVGGLQWSVDGQSLLLMTRITVAQPPHTTVHTIWEVSTTGDRTVLGRIVRDKHEQLDQFWDFAVTHDRRRTILFAGSYPQSISRYPLFWSFRANWPIATAYERLFAAPSSRRFLAVGIDTLQWVVLDEKLNIAPRLDATITPRRYPQSAFWSPDEEHAVVVTPLPMPARRESEAQHFNLTTGKTRLLGACDMSDRFVPTSRGDEVLHIGRRRIRVVGGKSRGGDGVFVSRIFGKDSRRMELAGFQHRGPRGNRDGHEKPYAMPCVSPDGRRIAIALPRPDGASGYRYWLVDLQGAKKPLAEDDATLYFSPYRVLAFVDEGKRLLAFDYERLFTVPIDADLSTEPPEE
ncbi:MAG: hypothetical protein AAF961_11300, partial [Planctomycetota bacterium]